MLILLSRIFKYFYKLYLSLGAHFFIIFFCFFSFLNFSNASQCNKFLNSTYELSEKTLDRQRYVDIAEASRRLRKEINSSQRTHDQLILNNYIKANFRKLNSILEIQISMVNNHRILQVIEKLKKISHKFFNSNEISLTRYRRLSLLYAQLMDFMPPTNADQFLQEHDLIYQKMKSRSVEFVSLILTDSDGLSDWVLNGGLLIPSSDNGAGYSILDPDDDVEYILTFANLSFRTLLWGRSRGIEFIGQTGVSVVVDGAQYLPSLFTVHDYVHALQNIRAKVDVSTLYWDKIEAYLDSSKLKSKDVKIIETLMFFIHHEYNIPMICNDKDPTIPVIDIVSNRFSTIIERLNDKKDFGQAFDGVITKEEVSAGYFNLYKMIGEVCAP